MNTAPRKLATIVALDVAGYSARTEADEAKTTTEVAALRQVIEGIANAHGGRVFNTAGDGFMLEFASSLAAVEAAGDLAQTCEPKVRVGVHLGDVVVQPNGDLLGHGVNVAARLMAKSDPGAALISADVRRTIRGPLAERLVSRGLMQLDKMAETIEAYAFPASNGVARVPMSPSQSPFLAVLPFDNLSDDRDMQFFSDGVAEEILQTVARARGVKVAGRGSSFQFRGQDKATRRVARELGVSHVLDGSVRKSGNRIRVSAHLVDARTEATLWTERYDRDLADVLALQDELAAAIAGALNSTLVHALQGHKVRPEAYELYLKARAAIASNWLTSEKQQAIAWLEQAIGLDPTFARAWGMLALARTTLLPMERDSVGEPQHAEAFSAAETSLRLDKNNAEATLAKAFLMPAFSHHAEKIALARRAASLAPSDAFLLAYAGEFTMAVGRVRDCVAQYAESVRLEPALPIMRAGLAMYTGASGRWSEACAIMEALYAKHPMSPLVWWCLVWAKAEAGKLDEALDMVAVGARLPPEFSRQDADRAAALLHLRTLPEAQSRAAVGAMFSDAGDGPLDLMVCVVAAVTGQHDMAISQLIRAIESGRSIGQSGSGPFGIRRASSTGAFFWSHWRSVRSDPRFAKLCAHIGLAQYWLASGEWPDCADEVAYDFRAECEKAAREVAKA